MFVKSKQRSHPGFFLSSYALSFYRSQKLLLQSNFFEQDQKFDLAQKLNLLMPCHFTGHKMFCAGPNFLSQPKNLTAFSASTKPFVPAQKPILLNANHLFVWHKMFVTATICK